MKYVLIWVHFCKFRLRHFYLCPVVLVWVDFLYLGKPMMMLVVMGNFLAEIGKAVLIWVISISYLFFYNKIFFLKIYKSYKKKCLLILFPEFKSALQ